MAADGLGAFHAVFRRLVIYASIGAVALLTVHLRSTSLTIRRLLAGTTLLGAGCWFSNASNQSAALTAAVPLLLLGVSVLISPKTMDDSLRAAALGSVLFALCFNLYGSTTGIYDVFQSYSRALTGLVGKYAFDVHLEEGFSASGGWIVLAFCGSTLALWLYGRLRIRDAALAMLMFAGAQCFFVAARLYLFSQIYGALGLINLQGLLFVVAAPIVSWLAIRSADPTGAHQSHLQLSPLSDDGPQPGWIEPGKMTTASASTLAIAICACAVGAASFSLQTLPRIKTGHKAALLLDAGFLDWKIPVDGQYGILNAGLFGLLPTALEMVDVQATISKAEISDDLLKSQDLLILINVQRHWTPDELNCVERFVGRGGSLLVLGDHTDLMGTQASLNAITSPFDIEFNFDAGYPCREEWYECLDCRSHPINAGVSSWHQASIAIGATLAVSAPAYPVIVGKYGFADCGIRANRQGAFLGNYQYEIGERLGDVALVAAREYGSGRVLVFGDTSPFQNGALVGSFDPFVQNVFGWLFERRSTVPAFVAAHTAMILGFLIGPLALLGLFYRRSLSPAAVSILSVAFSVGVFANCHRYESVAKRHDWAPLATRPVAWIDYTLVPRIPLATPEPDGTLGLTLNLIRDGFFPLSLRDPSPDVLEKGKVLFLLRPSRRIEEPLLQRFRSFMRTGGLIVLACGYPDKAPPGALLRSCGLDVADVPLGPVPIVDRQADLPQFVDAWPIMLCKDEKPPNTPGDSRDAGPSYKILYEKNGLANVVFARVGAGGLLVVGDGRFFGDANVESVEVFHKGNIRFIQTLLQTLSRSSDTVRLTSQK
jgi:hypothetical protein